MRPGSRAAPRRAAGFSYIGLLFLIVLIGLLLAKAGEVTRTAMRRDREAELLWVGHAYRDAIGRYLGQRGRFPRTLADLAGSADDAQPARYIRRLYRDPMTNGDWQPVLGPDGGIQGVASASTLEPFKKSNFEDVDADFDKAASYTDWKFVFNGTGVRRTRTGARPR